MGRPLTLCGPILGGAVRLGAQRQAVAQCFDPMYFTATLRPYNTPSTSTPLAPACGHPDQMTRGALRRVGAGVPRADGFTIGPTSSGR